MASRRDKQGQTDDPFAERPITSQELDQMVYGGVGKVDPGRKSAEPVNIELIYPDRTQPRRAVPSVIRREWDETPKTAGIMFNRWIREAKLDLKQVQAILKGEEVEYTPAGVIAEGLWKVLILAASIHHDTLTNPITVSRRGREYLIETGERRWLAYHLLYANFGEEYKRIPARIVQRDIWRQASENNARDDLNAIGKARQFALLLMSLYREESWFEFDQLVQEGMCDRTFYAQVADGKQYPIPHGKAGQIMTAMGEKSRIRLNEYRRLLRDLDENLWVQYDDENWALDTIIKSLRPTPPENESIRIRIDSTGDETADGNGGEIEGVNSLTAFLEKYPYLEACGIVAENLDKAREVMGEIEAIVERGLDHAGIHLLGDAVAIGYDEFIKTGRIPWLAHRIHMAFWEEMFGDVTSKDDIRAVFNRYPKKIVPTADYREMEREENLPLVDVEEIEPEGTVTEDALQASENGDYDSPTPALPKHGEGEEQSPSAGNGQRTGAQATGRFGTGENPFLRRDVERRPPERTEKPPEAEKDEATALKNQAIQRMLGLENPLRRAMATRNIEIINGTYSDSERQQVAELLAQGIWWLATLLGQVDGYGEIEQVVKTSLESAGYQRE